MMFTFALPPVEITRVTVEHGLEIAYDSGAHPYIPLSCLAHVHGVTVERLKELAPELLVFIKKPDESVVLAMGPRAAKHYLITLCHRYSHLARRYWRILETAIHPGPYEVASKDKVDPSLLVSQGASYVPVETLSNDIGVCLMDVLKAGAKLGMPSYVLEYEGECTPCFLARSASTIANLLG